MKSWTIESYSGQRIDLQLIFEKPLEVSQNIDPDKLLIHLRMSEWEASDGDTLPIYVPKEKAIPR